MLIYSFITDYQAFSLRYKDNTTRDKNETKVGKQSANLGKNNEPIQNRLSFLIDCKSVILHHLTILSFPMVRPAWDNWWLLVDIIKAMRDNHVIFISYYSYYNEKYFEFDIHPYFVKAFKKRWYVVAYSPGTNDIRCYALDRMENVIISEEVFKMPKDLEPAEYFKDCFGIINNKDSEVQKVVLKVDAFQSNYIRNLPLHESQKEAERTEEYSIFEYHLKPEFDFEQEIFSNMDTVEVLEPQWLRDEVAERLRNLAEKYKI